jgi:bile acid:Na+ symporter, BASS family
MSTRPNIVAYFEQASLLTLALNAATVAPGYCIAVLFKLNRVQEISISLESGIQNGTLPISIATALLGNSAFAPAVYGLIMFFMGGAII